MGARRWVLPGSGTRGRRPPSASTPSIPRTPPGRSCCGSTARQPDGGPRRPGGPQVGSHARGPGVQRRVPLRVHGTVRPERSSSTDPTAWSPSTRCRSGRTWPASAPRFYGDAELFVAYLQEVRKHVGLAGPRPAGRRRGGARRRRARGDPARALPLASGADGRRPADGPVQTCRCLLAGSTSGSRSMTVGPSPNAWPAKGVHWSALEFLRSTESQLRACRRGTTFRPSQPRRRAPEGVLTCRTHRPASRSTRPTDWGPPEIKPRLVLGRALLIAGGLLAALGIAGVLNLRTASRTSGAGVEGGTGAATVTFEKPGEYSIYYEDKSKVCGTSRATPVSRER